MRWLFFWRPPAYLRTVVVNFRHDEDTAVRGVLWSASPSWLVLKQAALLKSKVDPAAIDGDVLVPRDDVAFVQVLP